MKLVIFINFGGNCAEAFRFYEEHLGGKILSSMMHGESPVATDAPPGWENKVLNSTMQLGETVLMGAGYRSRSIQANVQCLHDAHDRRKGRDKTHLQSSNRRRRSINTSVRTVLRGCVRAVP